MNVRTGEFVLVVTLGGVAAAGFAQPRIAWSDRFDGPDRGEDVAYHMTVDGAGNVYVLGTTATPDTDDDIIVIKYDRGGRIAWFYQYDGPGHGEDVAIPIFLDEEGNVYVAGWSYGGPETQRDMVTIKIGPDGQEVWAARYNGPANRDDYLYGVHAIALDEDGHVYVIGNSVGSSGYYEAVTLKYDADGTESWVHRRVGPPNTHAFGWALALSDSDEVYVAGDGRNPNTNSADVTLVQYDVDGNFNWINYYDGAGGSDDGPYDMEMGPAGDLYVVGISRNVGGDIDAATWKVAPDGQLIWDAYFDAASGPEYAFDLEVGDDGSVTTVGSLNDRWGNQDTLTLRYDTNGQLLWMRTFDHPNWFGKDELFYVQLGSDGSVYVIGESWNGWNDGINAIAIKYLPDGTQDWLYEYNSPGSGDDAFFSLAVDGFDNVYTTGVSLGEGRTADVITFKLVQNDCSGLERISSVRCKAKGGKGKATVKLDGGVPNDPFEVQLDSGPQAGGSLNGKGKAKVKFKDLPLGQDTATATWPCGARDARAFECG
ncbi:MAG: hypothetical protein C4547_16785 [Phycisphaerales bacterium]|nr:MAG: hypothetical protein C4547_16785 [Phycisphaerales bacterium]